MKDLSYAILRIDNFTCLDEKSVTIRKIAYRGIKKMKKRTKITLRTKIYLTIAGLLTLTGVFYASNPSVFVMSRPRRLPAHKPGRVKARFPECQFYVTQYENGQIETVDCLGMGSFFTTIVSTGLVEKYMTIAPAESAAAGFTPGDLFVTRNQRSLRPRHLAMSSCRLRIGPEYQAAAPIRTTARLRSTKWAHLATK